MLSSHMSLLTRNAHQAASCTKGTSCSCWLLLLCSTVELQQATRAAAPPGKLLQSTCRDVKVQPHMWACGAQKESMHQHQPRWSGNRTVQTHLQSVSLASWLDVCIKHRLPLFMELRQLQ
jgi:hypothetical protein